MHDQSYFTGSPLRHFIPQHLLQITHLSYIDDVIITYYDSFCIWSLRKQKKKLFIVKQVNFKTKNCFLKIIITKKMLCLHFDPKTWKQRNIKKKTHWDAKVKKEWKKNRTNAFNKQVKFTIYLHITSPFRFIRYHSKQRKRNVKKKKQKTKCIKTKVLQWKGIQIIIFACLIRLFLTLAQTGPDTHTSLSVYLKLLIVLLCLRFLLSVRSKGEYKTTT